MLTLTLYLVSLLLLLLSVTAAENPSPPYTPIDLILLNCGASSNTTSVDGRNWDGDSLSKFSPPNIQTASSAYMASAQDPSVTLVPYMTTRIIHSKFTYTFPVSPGPKFVRLYFYPATYSGLDKTTSFFSVMANSYMLLKNFSAYLTVSAMNPPVTSFIKEFIVTVWDRQLLNITFTPSPTSYAFINGIEIVSMPNNLYTSHGSDTDPMVPFVSSDTGFYYDNTTALETAYRLNVGGTSVESVDDTGMLRSWLQDSDYMFGQLGGVTPYRDNVTIHYTADTQSYVAPEIVYTTSRTMGPHPHVNLQYNLTWNFPIDSGFNYLVRLHFCETQLEVTRENQRVFSIFINNQTAVKDADVINWSGGTEIPVYKDYVVWVPNGDGSKQVLWLALHPYMDLDPKPQNADAILNGLEIFKLNKSDGSLAGPNPDPMVDPTQTEQYGNLPERKSSRGSSKVMVIIGAVLAVVLAFSLLACFIVFKRKRTVKDSGMSDHKSSWVPFSYTVTSTSTTTSSLPSDLCRRFSIIEIKVATNNFDDHFIIGSGGFGNVYKGTIDSGVTVAIKRLNSSSRQGAREFQTEIEMLSKLRHVHLVALIGYCDDQGEMILVYEYMSHGTLRDHLYKTKNQPLPWKQRLQVCIGAARGLHYLHTGAKHTIIHRDVKATNILLDENWVAKVSDFGLSKVGPTSMSQTHVSTVVKGSFGYVDPEYYRRQQLTEKSDVYSFGVVLFEVLCARPSVIPGLPKEQVSLVQWAQNCYQRGTLDQIMDPNLRGDVAPVCLKKFGEIANHCVRDKGIERPTMGDVVWGLEFALQLQETVEKNINGGDGFNIDDHGVQESPLIKRGEAITTDDDDLFTGSSGHVSESRSTVSSGGRSVNYCDPNKVRSDAVFSEIVNPKGR